MIIYLTNEKQTKWYFQRLNEIGVIIGKNHECVEITPNSRTNGYTTTTTGLTKLAAVSNDVELSEIIENNPPMIFISAMDCYDFNNKQDLIEWCNYLQKFV